MTSTQKWERAKKYYKLADRGVKSSQHFVDVIHGITLKLIQLTDSTQSSRLAESIAQQRVRIRKRERVRCPPSAASHPFQLALAGS